MNARELMDYIVNIQKRQYADLLNKEEKSDAMDNEFAYEREESSC